MLAGRGVGLVLEEHQPRDHDAQGGQPDEEQDHLAFALAHLHLQRVADGEVPGGQKDGRDGVEELFVICVMNCAGVLSKAKERGCLRHTSSIAFRHLPPNSTRIV